MKTKWYPLNTNRASCGGKIELQNKICHSHKKCTLRFFLAISDFFFGCCTNTHIVFFPSVFHFRTMMSRTQIFFLVSDCFEYQRLHTYISFAFPTSLLLRPLIRFRWLHRLLKHGMCALFHAWKHANRIYMIRKFMVLLVTKRKTTNNPFFIHIQSTRSHCCDCKH